MAKKERSVFVSLLVAGLLVRLFYCWSVPSESLLEFVTDDAMINFAAAKHLAKGEGFRADGMHFTNSAHYLAALASPPCQYVAGDDRIFAIRLTLSIASVIWVGSGILLFLLANHYFGTYLALATLFIFTTSPIGFLLSMTGVDPPYTMFFLLASLYLHFVVLQRGRSGTESLYFVLGLLSAMSYVSRHDHSLFALLIFLDLVVRNRKHPRRILTRSALFALGFLCLAAFLQYTSFKNTGQAIPSSAVIYSKLRDVAIKLVLSHREELLTLFEKKPLVFYGLAILIPCFYLLWFLVFPMGVSGSPFRLVEKGPATELDRFPSEISGVGSFFAGGLDHLFCGVQFCLCEFLCLSTLDARISYEHSSPRVGCRKRKALFSGKWH